MRRGIYFFKRHHFKSPLLPQVFLKSDRVARMVQSGGCSANDSREVFKKHIEKRVRSLPEIDGLSKETVLSSWMAKFDAIYRGEEDPRKQQARMTASAASELILSKEQLYEMFQNILGIKKFEHQLLYNACQVRASPRLGGQGRGLLGAVAAGKYCCYRLGTLGLTRWFLRKRPQGPSRRRGFGFTEGFLCTVDSVLATQASFLLLCFSLAASGSL